MGIIGISKTKHKQVIDRLHSGGSDSRDTMLLNTRFSIFILYFINCFNEFKSIQQIFKNLRPQIKQRLGFSLEGLTSLLYTCFLFLYYNNVVS